MQNEHAHARWGVINASCARLIKQYVQLILKDWNTMTQEGATIDSFFMTMAFPLKYKRIFLFIFFSVALVSFGTLKPRTIMKTTQTELRTIMKTLEMQPVETTTKTTKKNKKQNVRPKRQNTNKKSPKQNVTKPPKNLALWQAKVINTTNAATPPLLCSMELYYPLNSCP
jgi:hypothetical protein